MINECLKPEQKLAVGSHEHAQIIEENLGISCLYRDAVMELMWGLKNCLNSLVPGELIKGERPPMCKGMRTVLDKYYFDYKPEMVNDDLTELVCIVYTCDYGVQMHFDTLHRAGKQLMNISEINCKDWDLLKLATALKWVSCPEEPVIDPGKIFSEDECNRIERDAPKYKDKLWKRSILAVYNQILEGRIIRHKWLSRMNYFLKEAEEECKAEQVMSSADPVH